jgi:hypothetical protein
MRIDRRTLLAATAAVSLGSARFSATRASGPSWTLLTESGPAPRWDHNLLADASGRALFLFGGRDPNGLALADLWRFDLATGAWTSQEVAGPAARFGSAAAVDSEGAGFLLFGGQSADQFYNDLWRFDFADGVWSQIDDGTAVAPTPRYGLGAAIDPAGRLVISHGFTFEGRFDDTWSFDPGSAQWTDISPPADTRPLRRCLHELANEIGDDRILLYAGCSSGYGPCPQGDLWLLDLTAGTWSNMTPATGPAARSNPGVVWQESGLYLFGGLTESGPANDQWIGSFVDGAFVWSELTNAGEVPAARSSHDLATLDQQVYLFGGVGEAGVMGDLWRLVKA